MFYVYFFFSSRRRHTRSKRDWSSDVCSSDLLENRALFPTLNGSSLMKALLYITYHDQLNLEMMSLDTITETEVEETFSELQLSLNSVKLFSYKGYKTTEALIKFHYDLFKSNQTK